MLVIVFILPCVWHCDAAGTAGMLEKVKVKDKLYAPETTETRDC